MAQEDWDQYCAKLLALADKLGLSTRPYRPGGSLDLRGDKYNVLSLQRDIGAVLLKRALEPTKRGRPRGSRNEVLAKTDDKDTLRKRRRRTRTLRAVSKRAAEWEEWIQGGSYRPDKNSK
jgi:hypothetical protein